MVQANFSSVYYYISQSFLGNITDNMKAISVSYDNENRHLLMHVFLYKEETDVDRECAYSALSEAESMFDLPITYKIQFINIDRHLTHNDRLDFWIYMKYNSDGSLSR